MNGSDILHSYKGDISTSAVLKAQGFDGLPKVVGDEEFEEAVKESSFIAQRTYSASNEEILKEYQDMLYDGEFYVDCTEGGSQYGQGMYCAADYNGELTEGIESEMEHYQELGAGRNRTEAKYDYINTLTKDDLNSTFYLRNESLTDDEARVFFEIKGSDKTLRDLSSEDRAIAQEMQKGPAGGKWTSADLALDSFVDPWLESYTGHSVVETLTLDPSAKIVPYREVENLQSEGEQYEYRSQKIAEYTSSQDTSEGCAAWFRCQNFSWTDYKSDYNAYQKWQKESPEKAKAAEDYWKQIKIESQTKDENKYANYDAGALAALMGYDAINAEGHGDSGSYTVVLNRTKMILQDNRIVSKAEGQVRMSAMTFEPGKDGKMNAIKDGKVVGWVLPFGTWDDKKSSGKSQGKKMKKSEAERMVNQAVEKATATLAQKDSKGRTLPQFMEYEEMEAELDRNDALIKKSAGAERRDLVNRNFDLQSEMDWRWAKSQGSLSSFKNKKEGET